MTENLFEIKMSVIWRDRELINKPDSSTVWQN